jgi:uncharacterized membrane protein
MPIKHSDLPSHIEDTIRSVATLEEEHANKATAFHRIIARVARFLGSPRFFVSLTVVIGLWILINFLAVFLKMVPFDRPPFAGLQFVVSLFSLFMTTLILGAQQRDERIATHRERLTLQLAGLIEQKSAKIIQLLEDLRRDSPFVRNRVDTEAAAMATPGAPQAVREAVKEVH